VEFADVASIKASNPRVHVAEITTMFPIALRTRPYDEQRPLKPPFTEKKVRQAIQAAIKSEEFIEIVRSGWGLTMTGPILVARATGCQDWQVIIRHILPTIAAPIMVVVTLGLGVAILAESSLSFLGFGVPPPTPSWGAMLSGSGRTYVLQAPWMAIFPGIAISLAVFGFNMLGDALRDLLDPKLRGGPQGRA
jgi:ABC-type transport system substrate-binding protein